MIGSTELILVAVVVMVLFGGKKIPELMRGLGKGVRSFKEGMNEITQPEEPTKNEQVREEEKGEQ